VVPIGKEQYCEVLACLSLSGPLDYCCCCVAEIGVAEKNVKDSKEETCTSCSLGSAIT
jgi:hypothetical protein